MRRAPGGYLLLLTGFIARPCHGALPLPVVVGLLGGTALGGWLSTHTRIVYGPSAGYFLAALSVAVWWLNRRHTTDLSATAASCPPQPAPRERATAMEGRPH